jgi:hypothetical protein
MPSTGSSSSSGGGGGSNSGAAPGADKMEEYAIELYLQFQGQFHDHHIAVQEHDAFAARITALYTRVDQQIFNIADKRVAYRAAHGPGSSWAAGSIRGFVSAEHARLLDAVSCLVDQLESQEHADLQHALLHSAAEYAWQQLPVGDSCPVRQFNYFSVCLVCALLADLSQTAADNSSCCSSCLVWQLKRGSVYSVFDCAC